MIGNAGIVLREGLHRSAWAGALILALTASSIGRPGFAQQYSTPDEALRAGVSSLRVRQYEKARAPLEQALSMAKDDPTRLRVYQALVPVYYNAGNTDKLISALDFVLTKSDSEPERGNVRRSLISYVKMQGKTDEIRNRYEDRLKKDPNDIPALYVLSDIYTQLQPNPKRSGEILDQLSKLAKSSKGDNTAVGSESLAKQYTKAGKYEEGATMFEQLAAAEPTKSAVLYKEAAQAWLQGGNKAKALAAAKASDASPPEDRSELLEHYWHRALGDVFLKTNEPTLAIKHYELAIAKTDISGYKKDTQKTLAQARALAAKSGSGSASVAPASTGGSAPKSKFGTVATSAKSGTVDLNRASLSELQAVDGISEALAIQIIDRRKSKPFTSVSELIELDDVDKALLAKIRPALTVGPR